MGGPATRCKVKGASASQDFSRTIETRGVFTAQK